MFFFCKLDSVAWLIGYLDELLRLRNFLGELCLVLSPVILLREGLLSVLSFDLDSRSVGVAWALAIFYIREGVFSYFPCLVNSSNFGLDID